MGFMLIKVIVHRSDTSQGNLEWELKDVSKQRTTSSPLYLKRAWWVVKFVGDDMHSKMLKDNAKLLLNWS